MTFIDWTPEHAGELALADICGTTCDRHPHWPDRDDPGVEWCAGCGACIGEPSANRPPGFLAQLERIWVKGLGLFGHEPTEGAA